VSLARTVRELPPESRLAGGAAAALIVSMVLPWYQVVAKGGEADSRSAFQVFTWVEAAILLVAATVLFLVWARTQQKRFHLPGGDGFAVSLAGGWVLVLLIWRLFDKPEANGAATTVGIDWGIFVALVAGGALVAAGAQMRAAHRPEPPNPMADEPDWEVPERRPRERTGNGRPREHTEVTQVLRERPPEWEGDAPEAPGGEPRRRTGPDRPASDPRGDDPSSRDDPPSDRRF
jgi:hypothetical protein